MSANRTNRGVLILTSILALILGVIYLNRRHQHPLDVELRLKTENVATLSDSSTVATDSVKPKVKKSMRKSSKRTSRKGENKQPVLDLPSPHDAPVSTIRN